MSAKVLVPWYRDDSAEVLGHRDRRDLDGFDGQKRWAEAESIVAGGDGSAYAGTLVSGEMPDDRLGGWTERGDLVGFDGRPRWWQCSNGTTPCFTSARQAEGYPFAAYPIGGTGSTQTCSAEDFEPRDWAV